MKIRKFATFNETNCRISLDKIANNGTKWDLVGLCEMQEKTGFLGEKRKAAGWTKTGFCNYY